MFHLVESHEFISSVLLASPGHRIINRVESWSGIINRVESWSGVV